MHIKLTLFLLLCSATMVFAQQTTPLDVSMEEQLTIGNDPEKSIEHSFGRIEGFVADQNGRIYVSDSEVQSIRVFDEEGNYIKSIGRRGRGPGEFLRLDFLLLHENMLYAADPLQFRISKFDLDGNLVETIPTPKRSQVLNFFQQIFPYDNRHFLILYKQWGSGDYAEFNRDEIFHIWEKDFTEEITSFGSFNRFGWEENTYARLHARSKVGSMVLSGNDRIIIAPYLYDGQLFIYEKENDEWKFSHTINGTNFEIPSYINLNRDNGDEDTNMVRSASINGTVYGKVNVRDAGLYTMADNYLVHFLFIKKDDTDNLQWEFGAELFDNNLNHLGYYPLDIYDYSDISTRFRSINYQDHNGNFYMHKKEDGAEVLQVFSLEISESH